MLISEIPDHERKNIVALARDRAAFYTDENWLWLECGSREELLRLDRENPGIDLYCLDLTIPGTLEAAKSFRAASSDAYIILVATASISPLTYMRPSVSAESLMIKPLSRAQVEEVLDEAIHSYSDRFLGTAESSFVLESQGSRELIDYSRIFYFESRDKKIYLNTSVSEYGFYDTLDQLENRLEQRFLRVHRSFLVNRSKIRKVRLSDNQMFLEDNVVIPVSRTYKKAIRMFLEERQQDASGN